MNVLIVEGKEDKAFLDYLLNGAKNVKVENPPEIIELGGLSKDALKKQIGSVMPRITGGKIERLGIIIDLDLPEEGGFEKRLELVNKAIKESFDEFFTKSGKNTPNISTLEDSSQFIKVSIDNNTEIEIACFFIHIDGKGELEDVLRKIKIHESNHADCLGTWRKCLKAKSIEKTDKEINKLWLQIFMRYDICTKDEQESANKHCSLKYVVENKANVFNFDHECLDELKEFLKMFTETSN